jgi:hypothetical protein
MSFMLAVRMRLPTDVFEAFVDVRERLFVLGDEGECGACVFDAALRLGESGCGKGTGVGTSALEGAIVGVEGAATVSERWQEYC